MGILSRMLTLWKADLHGVMDQIEDKPLLLKQYLREMEVDLRRKEARREQLDQTIRQLRRDVEMCEQESARLEQDLELALLKEKDAIARVLIRKQRAQIAVRGQLQRRIQVDEAQRQQLTETLDRQHLQYDQLQLKAAAVCSQSESVRWDDAAATCTTDPAGQPSEEEVELELIRRKEVLRQGGAA